MVVTAKMDELNEDTENQDLKAYLSEQVDSQIVILGQVCKEERKRNL